MGGPVAEAAVRNLLVVCLHSRATFCLKTFTICNHPLKHGLLECRLHQIVALSAQEAMGSLASRNSAQTRFDPASLVDLLRAAQTIPEDLWAAGREKLFWIRLPATCAPHTAPPSHCSQPARRHPGHPASLCRPAASESCHGGLVGRIRSTGEQHKVQVHSAAEQCSPCCLDAAGWEHQCMQLHSMLNKLHVVFMSSQTLFCSCSQHVVTGCHPASHPRKGAAVLQTRIGLSRVADVENESRTGHCQKEASV